LRRLLVTGGTGFVGCHLLPALRQAFPDAAVQAAEFDVTEAAAVTAALREMRPDGCVHLAAISAVPAARQDPRRAWQVNLLGTLNLAEAILAHAPDCVFLLASSADAYGRSFRSGALLDESAALDPASIYGSTKAAADLAIGALASDGLRAIRVRPFNHIGPGQSAAFVVTAFAEQVARIAAGVQPPVLRVGQLESRRDFLDVRDVCAAYVACLQRAESLTPGIIINVASGVPRRIGDVLDALVALAGIEARIEVEPSRLRSAEIAVAAGDASRARALLGWRPSISWERSLRDVLEERRALCPRPQSP